MSIIQNIFIYFALIVAIQSCLITNCPRGGKRNGRNVAHVSESSVKKCISCGPGMSGQCFGPAICCGPFGCLLATPDTARCIREGAFYESEPCVAGNSGNCRRNTGRCAADGICCTQDSCHEDKACSIDEKPRFLQDTVDLYSMLNEYTIDK